MKIEGLIAFLDVGEYGICHNLLLFVAHFVHLLQYLFDIFLSTCTSPGDLI